MGRCRISSPGSMTPPRTRSPRRTRRPPPLPQVRSFLSLDAHSLTGFYNTRLFLGSSASFSEGAWCGKLYGEKETAVETLYLSFFLSRLVTRLAASSTPPTMKCVPAKLVRASMFIFYRILYLTLCLLRSHRGGADAFQPRRGELQGAADCTV